jgi:23S rRNA (pseudouridine1915-N3)-methyltransferase
MKFELWVIGRNESYVSEGMAIFEKRIGRYAGFEIKYFEGDKKAKTPDAKKGAESNLILNKLEQKDYLIILDERGKEYSSEKFAEMIGSRMAAGPKKVIFLIGGAYGMEESLRNRANLLISLSKMTLSHQIARVMFAEQLYRAFTILKNEPYHHA